MKQQQKWIGRGILLAALAVGGWFVWQGLRPAGLGDGFVSGNGRIEATEIDVATKLPGRIAEIAVDEGDLKKKHHTWMVISKLPSVKYQSL